MAKVKKSDIYIKARILSEGLNIEEDIVEVFLGLDPSEVIELELPDKIDLNNPEEILDLYCKSSIQSATNAFLGTTFRLKGSGLITPVFPNKYSRLDLKIEGKGDRATISDGGKVLAKGNFNKKPDWLNSKLSNGMPIEVFLPAASDEIINVVITLSCMNYNTKRGCKYCNLFANPVSRKISMLPIETLDMWSKYQVEAVKIATDNGWRGNIAISGGALSYTQRKESLERIELVMDNLRDGVGEKILSELNVVGNLFPPEDFSDMYKWKEMGIDATSIDLEVMDPAYFAAICPGKNAYKPHDYWKKAQEYSLKVFGVPRTYGCLVVGIEPMDSLVQGVDERLSKGIIPLPLFFSPAPGSALDGFNPPSADWFVEASEKIADSFLTHAPKFLGPAIKKAMKEKGGLKALIKLADNTTSLSTVFDEIKRRIRGYKFAGIGLKTLRYIIGGSNDDSSLNEEEITELAKELD